jgi:hypothetical protein
VEKAMVEGMQLNMEPDRKENPVKSVGPTVGWILPMMPQRVIAGVEVRTIQARKVPLV